MERVPGWFVDLLGFPDVGASFPVTIEGKQVGDIVFAPDMSADVYEKWIGFLAIATSGDRPDAVDGRHRLFRRRRRPRARCRIWAKG